MCHLRKSGVFFLKMSYRFAMTAVITSLLFGCASHDGTYLPGCIAYEGSKISLNEGTFVWEKFTDSVTVDDAGNVKNPFPGYPMQGSYRIKGQVLSLDAGPGESLANMFLQEYRQRDYLLTAEEFETWERTGTVRACALVSGGHPGSE